MIKIIHFVKPSVRGIFHKYENIASVFEDASIINLNNYSKLKYLFVVFELLKLKTCKVILRYNLELSILFIFYCILLKINRNFIYLEIPTPFYSHLKTKKSVFNIANYYLFSVFNFILADKIVIYAKENGFLKYIRNDFLLITNGIKKNQVKIKVTDNYINDVLNIVCIANIAPWHGLDLLPQMIQNYQLKEKLNFHIVGSNYFQIKKITEELQLTHCFNFYGELNQDEIYNVVNKCQLAISTLNWESINVYEASPIKSREYCMYGLPFIYSAIDHDFINANFCFKLESNNKIDSLYRIIQYILENNNLPEPFSINKFANDYLVYEEKFSFLLN